MDLCAGCGQTPGQGAPRALSQVRRTATDDGGVGGVAILVVDDDNNYKEYHMTIMTKAVALRAVTVYLSHNVAGCILCESMRWTTQVSVL